MSSSIQIHSFIIKQSIAAHHFVIIDDFSFICLSNFLVQFPVKMRMWSLHVGSVQFWFQKHALTLIADSKSTFSLSIIVSRCDPPAACPPPTFSSALHDWKNITKCLLNSCKLNLIQAPLCAFILKVISRGNNGDEWWVHVWLEPSYTIHLVPVFVPKSPPHAFYIFFIF